MKGIRFFSLALVLSLGAGAAGCQSKPESATQVDVAQSGAAPISELLDPTGFKAAMSEEGAQIVDVRTIGEVEKGYIPGAQHIDISNWDAFKAEIAKLDKDSPVLVYCAVGGRSGRAADYLEEAGFNQIFDLKGGINAWNAASGDIVK